jgi:hypothetical protein
MIHGEYLVKSLLKLEESKPKSAITILFALLSVQEGLISRGRFGGIVGTDDRSDIDDYIEKYTNWNLWNVSLPVFSVEDACVAKTFDRVPYPICPFSIYFEGDEDKCDVSMCDYDDAFRSCTRACERYSNVNSSEWKEVYRTGA